MSGIKLGIEEMSLLEKIKGILENNILLEDEVSLKEKEKELLKLKNDKLLEKLNDLQVQLDVLTKENNELKKLLNTNRIEESQNIEETNISNEVENQIENKENLKRSWMDYENFKKHENNLIDYIKKLTVNDLKEIYKVGKNTKTLKGLDERNISDVLTRLKLNIPLTNDNLENIESIYYKVINELHKRELKVEKKADTNSLKDNFLENGLNYKSYLENKNKLNEFILKLSLNDFKKMHLLGKQENIFDEMEERQILTVITWLKWNTPLKKLNVDKIINIYVKFMENFYKKEEVEKGTLACNLDKKEKSIKDSFGDILAKGLENGFVEMADLKRVDYDNDKDAYDVYEAIEILESRGVRIKY